MNFDDVMKLLTEAMEETVQPVDDSSVIADCMGKARNGGVMAMFYAAQIKLLKLAGGASDERVAG